MANRLSLYIKLADQWLDQIDVRELRDLIVGNVLEIGGLNLSETSIHVDFVSWRRRAKDPHPKAHIDGILDSPGSGKPGLQELATRITMAVNSRLIGLEGGGTPIVECEISWLTEDAVGRAQC